MCPHKLLVRSDVLASEIAGELVLYDSRTQQAHCVAPAAVRVWRLADGSRSYREIVAEGGGGGLSEAAVAAALEEFAQLGLLERGGELPIRPSRRSVLRKAAGVCAAPLIVSIVTPTAADAASGPTLRSVDGRFSNFHDPLDPSKFKKSNYPPKPDSPGEAGDRKEPWDSKEPKDSNEPKGSKDPKDPEPPGNLHQPDYEDPGQHGRPRKPRKRKKSWKPRLERIRWLLDL